MSSNRIAPPKSGRRVGFMAAEAGHVDNFTRHQSSPRRNDVKEDNPGSSSARHSDDEDDTATRTWRTHGLAPQRGADDVNDRSPDTRQPDHLNELDESNIEELDAKVQAAKKAQERAFHTHEDVEVSEHSSSEGDSSHPSPRSGDTPQNLRLRGSTLYRKQEDDIQLNHDEFLRHEREGDFVQKPSHFRLGGLGALNLLNKFGSTSSSATSSPFTTPSQSRASSPERHGAGAKRRRLIRSPHSLSSIFKPKKSSKHVIRQHVSETHIRKKYILKLCRALMKYGAPTHRLEALMVATAHVLEVEAQFLYFPGVMVVSFDDRTTSTADVRMVRVAQGVDLGKMLECHHIYKWVLYGDVVVGEACDMLDALEDRPNKFRRNFLILVHGFASLTVGPWAFQAQWLDLPIAFCFGILLGWLRLVWAPKTEMWTNVFEIVVVIVTSFLSRAFGSIAGDSSIFCFSSLAQSSIALILPGYIVLCAALELQSHSIIAGSIRMVYAFLYSLTIGFGLTVGTVIYGIIDRGATTMATCPRPIDRRWYILFMPGYALCLCILNQAKWKQMPIMLIIAATSYVVSYFSSLRFTGNSEISSALAALCFSIMSNIYGRLGKHWDRGQDILFSRISSFFSALRPTKTVDVETQTEKPTHNSRFRGIFVKLWSAIEYNDPATSELGSQPGAEKPERGLFADLKAYFKPSPQGRQRVTHALSSAVMLPAVFVLVPSGLSSQGSLVSSLQTSAQINGNSSASTTLTTQDIVSGRTNDSSTFTVGYSIIQIAIGLTVGMFFGSALVYPTSGQSGNLDRFSRPSSPTHDSGTQSNDSRDPKAASRSR